MYLTPHEQYRNADSPTETPDGEVVFAKPWEEDQPFPDFLDYVIRQEKEDASAPGVESEVRYAQTRKSSEHASGVK